MTKDTKTPVAETKEATTRARTARKKVYERARESELPEGLIAHFKKDDWELRLVRFLINGQEDYRSLDGRLKEGYEFVTPTEIPEQYLMTMKVIPGQRGGLVTLGDLCLMKVDKELREGRRQHFDKLTREQLQAVDINVLERKGFKDLGSRSKILNKEPTFQS